MKIGSISGVFWHEIGVADSESSKSRFESIFLEYSSISEEPTIVDRFLGRFMDLISSSQ